MGPEAVVSGLESNWITTALFMLILLPMLFWTDEK